MPEISRVAAVEALSLAAVVSVPETLPEGTETCPASPKVAETPRKSARPCRKLAQPSRKLRSHPEMYPVVIYIREVQGQGVFMFKIMKHYVTICNN
ncbi:MAG: hypothetical protein KAW12_13980 [Candidatus Aminicenantes bacterium]|nr:hypothetical protein [Candidatus Aminicenantes bacterium]